MNGDTTTQQMQIRTPCEHKFERLVKTTKGDVNVCNKCMWIFYQPHEHDRASTSMGTLIETAALKS